jgi:hypothetical protein
MHVSNVRTLAETLEQQQKDHEMANENQRLDKFQVFQNTSTLISQKLKILNDYIDKQLQQVPSHLGYLKDNLTKWQKVVNKLSLTSFIAIVSGICLIACVAAIAIHFTPIIPIVFAAQTLFSIVCGAVVGGVTFVANTSCYKYIKHKYNSIEKQIQRIRDGEIDDACIQAEAQIQVLEATIPLLTTENGEITLVNDFMHSVSKLDEAVGNIRRGLAGEESIVKL